MNDLTPQQIVAELNRYIIGQQRRKQWRLPSGIGSDDGICPGITG